MKSPSPRCDHSGWIYSQKLWIFGGFGPSPDGYLNDSGNFLEHHSDVVCNNQLLCFNPSCNEWENQECSGSIPSPRGAQALTNIKEKVWLYGGHRDSFVLDDLYELNMSSLIWTHVETGSTTPQGRYSCSLNALTRDQILLHGGVGSSDGQTLSDTWILHIPSQTWQLYKSGDYPREHHTGTTAINNNTIIIGGVPLNSSNEYKATFHIRLGPRSLQQLAMQTVYTYRCVLRWECLHKKLLRLILTF